MTTVEEHISDDQERDSAIEDQITRSDTPDSTAEYVVPVFTTEEVPRIRARESKDAKVGNLATRRAFLLKSVGVLGGVAHAHRRDGGHQFRQGSGQGN